MGEQSLQRSSQEKVLISRCVRLVSHHRSSQGEAYERVGIRLPTGAFTYASRSSYECMWPTASLANIRGIFRVAVSCAGRGEAGVNLMPSHGDLRWRIHAEAPSSLSIRT